ncbi:M1 family aminopeptidase [Pseudoclostridium thermosuccinogenes]|jgi:hypothetical protein|uniref:M1 family aminopeptidase n=1 Tax=Clostridium thermosuccinogenes TaxID=84032 RepID=UPI002FDB072C
MKKLIKAVLIILVIELASMSCLILYFAYGAQGNGDVYYEAYHETDIATKPAAQDKRTYNIEAEVEVAGNKIRVTEDIFFDTRKDKLELYIPSANAAETKIGQVVSDGKVTKVARQEALMEIQLENAWDSVRISYEILPGSTGSTIIYKDGDYYLTNFLITPAVYKDGKPVHTIKKGFGDPYIYEINNYRVTFKTENHLKAYAPGGKKEQTSDDYKITTFEASNIRDFPAVLIAGADVHSEKLGNVNLHFINSREAGEHVKEAFSFATANIGEYPYDDFYVVKAPISISGMEFSNMIFISPDSFSSSARLKRISYHEVLHQWFYGIIGTDQLNEPFFDEGLVDYLAAYLSNSKVKEWKNRDFKKPLKDYNSKSEYYELAYYDSSAYFHTIHQKLGNNFYRVLKDIYNDWKFKILYFDDFQKYVSKY